MFLDILGLAAAKGHESKSGGKGSPNKMPTIKTQGDAKYNPDQLFGVDPFKK